MKIVMTEEGKISYNGYEEVKYKKGQDITTIDKWAQDYFIKVQKAKIIVQKAKEEKAKTEKKEEIKVVKLEEPKKINRKPKVTPENKMVKEKTIENK